MRTSRESFLSRGRVHVWDRQRSNVRYVSFRLQQQCVKGDTKMLFPLMEKKNQSKKPDNFIFISRLFFQIYYLKEIKQVALKCGLPCSLWYTLKWLLELSGYTTEWGFELLFWSLQSQGCVSSVSTLVVMVLGIQTSCHHYYNCWSRWAYFNRFTGYNLRGPSMDRLSYNTDSATRSCKLYTLHIPSLSKDFGCTITQGFKVTTKDGKVRKWIEGDTKA